MTVLNEEERAWIKEHLDIGHDQLPREFALRWLELMLANRKSFYVLGLLGFILKRKRDAQQTKFTNEELSSFCAEFTLKIRLATRKQGLALSLPLFDLVGRDALRAYDLID